MGRNGQPTRKKILTQSKSLILEHGFSGTSIDFILGRTGITKGAFFYHFKTKKDLAKALILDFIKEDIGHMNDALIKTKNMNIDPLDRLFKFNQEFINMMSGLTEPNTGCLYASYTYEPGQFNEDILALISDTIILWRETYRNLLEDVLKEYNMIEDVDINSLADLFTVIFEGSFILEKALNEMDITAKQLKHLNSYLKLLFVKKK